MRNTFAHRRVALLAIAATLSAGCATAARPGNMVVNADSLPVPPASFSLAQTLRVASVSGGKATNPMWKSKIGNAEFRAALEQSLRAAQLLAVSSDGVQYLLDAELVRVDQPSFGFNLTVTMTVNYKLSEAATGRLVWRDSVAASHTAQFSEALAGVKRLRLANEGAARANIAELIDSLFLLKLGTS